MIRKSLKIKHIPSILWGKKSEKVYIFVHGRMSCKEDANEFAKIVTKIGYQVLSFDLPEHGDRKDGSCPCDVWNCISDLDIIGKYVQQNWDSISLFACSLGAYLSLLAYKNYSIKNCLFLSPILNMERLIRNMMNRFGVSEELLKEKRKIAAPSGETLDWDYFCYVKEHPINKWDVPTAILFGSEDNLT
jgi:alpha-beta hydrolase superfamily lysophospholipase